MKRYLLGGLLFVHNSLIIGFVPVGDVASGLVMAQDAVDLAVFVKVRVVPNVSDQEDAYLIKREINALKAEDLFYKCLVKNARSPRTELNLPSACQQLARSYMFATNSYRLNAQREQFLLATKDLSICEEELMEKGWSKRKKALIGGVVVAVGVGAVVAAPIVFPGAVIAAQSAVLVGTVKAGVVAAGTKIAGTGMATKVAALAAQNKLVATQIAILFTKKTRPLVYKTPNEELASLKVAQQKRTPLGEQVRLAQAKK